MARTLPTDFTLGTRRLDLQLGEDGKTVTDNNIHENGKMLPHLGIKLWRTRIAFTGDPLHWQPKRLTSTCHGVIRRLFTLSCSGILSRHRH